MKRSSQQGHRRRSQIVFWMLSVIVVLSMILGLAVSVLPQSGPNRSASEPLSFQFAVGGESAGDPAAFSRFLAQVAADGNLFLVHTGDLTSDGSDSSYQAFASLMSDSQLPLFPVPGEKDYHQGTPDNFRQYTSAPGLHYAFDYGPIHLAVANVALGQVSSAELAWLRADLAAASQSVKMVFMHYPPVSMAGVPDVALSGGEAFAALMAQQGVDWVFVGHLPGYREAEYQGVPYVFTSRPDPSLSRGLEQGNFHHYVRVTVRGEEVAVEVVPIEAG